MLTKGGLNAITVSLASVLVLRMGVGLEAREEVVGDDDALCTPCGRLPATHPRVRRQRDNGPHRGGPEGDARQRE